MKRSSVFVREVYKGQVVGFYEWIVRRCWHWRRISQDSTTPSPSLYLPIKINCSSKIVLLPGISRSSLITWELEAKSFLLSMFPVCACNANPSFPVDWDRNLNVALLCSKETPMPSRKHPVTWGRKWVSSYCGISSPATPDPYYPADFGMLHFAILPPSVWPSSPSIAPASSTPRCTEKRRQPLWPAPLAPALSTEASCWLSQHGQSSGHVGPAASAYR